MQSKWSPAFYSNVTHKAELVTPTFIQFAALTLYDGKILEALQGGCHTVRMETMCLHSRASTWTKLCSKIDELGSREQNWFKDFFELFIALKFNETPAVFLTSA